MQSMDKQLKDAAASRAALDTQLNIANAKIKDLESQLQRIRLEYSQQMKVQAQR